MKIKRIANEIKKKTSLVVEAEYNTVFLMTMKITESTMSLINDILEKYKIKISAIGIDRYGYIYFDLVEVD